MCWWSHISLGSYAGFDKNEFTSAAGGKPKVAKHLKHTKHYKNLVFIGDGATDLEACPPAVSLIDRLITGRLITGPAVDLTTVFDWLIDWLQDAFIGFGGNVVRESVRSKAKWYIYSFEELVQALEREAACAWGYWMAYWIVFLPLAHRTQHTETQWSSQHTEQAWINTTTDKLTAGLLVIGFKVETGTGVEKTSYFLNKYYVNLNGNGAM